MTDRSTPDSAPAQPPPGDSALEPLGLPAQLEALLFVADGPTPLGNLAVVLQTTPDVIEGALAELGATLAARGLRVQRVGDRVQLVTAPQVARLVEEFLGLQSTVRLSPAALETLAIVAYKQPLTRPALEALRGVNCDAVLKTLISRGLIEEVGRAEGVGRPILYGTTFVFLQHFGLTSLADLPALNLGDLSPAAERVPEGEPASIAAVPELAPEEWRVPTRDARPAAAIAAAAERVAARRREVTRARWQTLVARKEARHAS
jgi:segregation and condensation protein B